VTCNNTPTESPAELAARTEAARLLGQWRTLDGVTIPDRAGGRIVNALAELLLRHEQQVAACERRIHLLAQLVPTMPAGPVGSALQDSCGGPH